MKRWLITALIILFISGCASKQTKYQVRYVKGCSIDLSVATADTAKDIMKDVDMTDCEMKAGAEDAQ
jgi:hypothetical protein